MKRGQGGGEIPDASKTQDVLLSRRKFKDYEKCTFSFRFGIRDDLGLIRTRNNWDLQYGNGRDTLQVRMVTDDLSTITDLGESTWEALAKRQETKEGTEARVQNTIATLLSDRMMDGFLARILGL